MGIKNLESQVKSRNPKNIVDAKIATYAHCTHPCTCVPNHNVCPLFVKKLHCGANYADIMDSDNDAVGEDARVWLVVANDALFNAICRLALLSTNGRPPYQKHNIYD